MKTIKKVEVIKKFLKDGNLKVAMKALGKSKPTIYRYSAKVFAGKDIIDGRSLGNNRKYGK